MRVRFGDGTAAEFDYTREHHKWFVDTVQPLDILPGYKKRDRVYKYD